ncbi:hypothetical protein [Streptomyces sp. NPDC001781]
MRRDIISEDAGSNPAAPPLRRLGEAARRVTATLQQDCFGLNAVAEGDGATRYRLTCGDRVRVLRGAGLVIGDLVEPRPGPGARNGCDESDPSDRAHRWPAELLRVTHKP